MALQLVYILLIIIFSAVSSSCTEQVATTLARSAYLRWLCCCSPSSSIGLWDSYLSLFARSVHKTMGREAKDKGC
jgi:hypothetical protein